MGSRTVKAIAEEVLETMGQGKKAIVNKIAVKKGLSPKYADSGLIQKTKTFKDTIEKNKKPILERLEAIRTNASKALEEKDLTEEKATELSIIIRNITHDIQLLSGGKTENVGIEKDREALQELIKEIRG